MPLRVGAIAYTHYESDPRVRREAEALASRGDDVTIWTLRSDRMPRISTENGVRVMRIAMPRYRGGKAFSYAASYTQFLAQVGARLVLEHAKDRFDIVHVHTMPDFMVFAGLIPRLSGAKVLLDMHDLMPDLYALKFGLDRKGWAVSALKWTQRVATTFADAVICVHEKQYELLLRAGVPARKLSIVMNAADPILFPPRAKEPAAGPNDPIRLFYHGTVLERYGVDVAVRAFDVAKKKDPRLRLTILGGGDYVGEVKRVASALGLGGDSLNIVGEHRPLDIVAQEIRDAHIGVIPNRDDNEDSALPTKLLEYIAVGVPSIATRTRAITHFFDEKTVELVGIDNVQEMADAMVRLASDEKRRKEIVAAGRIWEEEFGWPVNRKLLFRTIDALCFEKILAERKNRQKSVEGVKTGTRNTPPKTKQQQPKKKKKKKQKQGQQPTAKKVEPQEVRTQQPEAAK